MDKELIQQVERLLKTGISSNYSNYIAMYEKLYGSKWRVCACKKIKLYNEINNWYILNKNKDDN